MKVLQIVTYISPDGAYGGPVRVALNHAKALTQLGHEVTVIGAAGGFSGSLPSSFDDYPVKLFPGMKLIPHTGFAGLVAPRMLIWLKKYLSHFDLVHIHVSRDLVTLPAATMARIAQKPLVIQSHGMIDSSKRWLAKPLDIALTIPALRSSNAVIHLTNKEKADLQDVARETLNTFLLVNGVNMPDELAVEHRLGPRNSPEVICLARIHQIKQPLTFIRASQSLNLEFPKVKFTLIGPDEGEAQKVCSAIDEQPWNNNVSWKGPLRPSETSHRLSEASTFVLPSKSELLSMATLEAMAVGLPVIIGRSHGLSSIVENENAGIVCDNSQQSCENALRMLLADAHLRIAMGKRAREVAEKIFSSKMVGSRLAEIYARVINSAKPFPTKL